MIKENSLISKCIMSSSSKKQDCRSSLSIMLKALQKFLSNLLALFITIFYSSSRESNLKDEQHEEFDIFLASNRIIISMYCSSVVKFLVNLSKQFLISFFLLRIRGKIQLIRLMQINFSTIKQQIETLKYSLNRMGQNTMWALQIRQINIFFILNINNFIFFAKVKQIIFMNYLFFATLFQILQFSFIYFKSMKLNMFKIRKNAVQDSNVSLKTPTKSLRNEQSIQNSVNLCQQQMKNLMSMFEIFMKVSIDNQKQQTLSINNSQTYRKSQLQYQTRDRHIIFDIPIFKQKVVSKPELQKWVTDLIMASFSSSFNYYVTSQMTFEQAKIFCSETILTNLLRFTEHYKLTQKQLQIINFHLSQHILDYLQRKYPLTLSMDANKALQKELQQTNNLDLLANDFLYTNRIIFKYRKDGNYNDIIMKVINKTLQIVDGQTISSQINGEEKVSNYQDFQHYMNAMFQRIYDEQWVNGQKFVYRASQKLGPKENKTQQKQKYVEKVKTYSSYMIGRKISENTPHFTENQINSKGLDIKSPAILRILTKWCEQLWQKFEKQSYFSERVEPVLLQDPQFINPFFKWMKTSIDKRMSIQKKAIQQFKKKLDSHCQYQQSIILLKYLEQHSINYIPKYQKAYGMFSTHMVKNLHSYITLYLNRLIHGILKVSQQFFQKQVDKSWDGWQSPPNLITFKIGDLMRCKCSSKQKQIVKLFKQILNVSSSNPQKLKIVRIKNRLREGTNDILINIKFNDSLICQIQLQVNNKSKSKFIECSNAFSHFIYELKRSIFGPITELCNIWNNFDARAKTFSKLIISEQVMINSAQKLIVPECIDAHNHNFQQYIMPFECTLCTKLYFHNNYIITNKKCSNCHIYQCARCQIRQKNNEQLRLLLFSNNEQVQVREISKIESKVIPNEGACLKIQSTSPKIEYFTCKKIDSKNWLFGRNQDNQIYEIAKVHSHKDVNLFFREYLLIKIVANPIKKVTLTDHQGVNFAVCQYLKQSYKEDKEAIILTQVRLQKDLMNNLINNDGGSEKDRKKIKRLQFASNYSDDISIFSAFQNITSVNLDYNHLSNTKPLSFWKKLQKLQMRQNKKLEHVGEQIGELIQLQEIKFSTCNITSITDKIGMLNNLEVFHADNNQLKSLPQSFSLLVKLKDINLKNNKIQSINFSFQKLINLKKFNISYNKIKEMPSALTSLINLTSLIASNNKITVLPKQISKLSMLQKLQLHNNEIVQLQGQTLSIEKLKTVLLHHNKLVQFNCDLSKCKNLQTLNLSVNQLTQVTPTIGSCTNLTNFQIYDNKLDSLPSQLEHLKKLTPKISLLGNKFTKFPSYICKFIKIQELNLQKNEIDEIPNQIGKLKQLKKFSISNNKLKVIPQQFKQLKNITSIDFKNNNIQKVPQYLLQFECIKSNYKNIQQRFQNNEVKQLSPSTWDKMGSNIKFTNNWIEKIPVNSLTNKLQITVINLSSNKIAQIPRQIKQFANLIQLILQKNLIELVPIEVASLSLLKGGSLSLGSNPITMVECIDFAISKGDYNTVKIMKELKSPKKQMPTESLASDKKQSIEGQEESSSDQQD